MTALEILLLRNQMEMQKDLRVASQNVTRNRRCSRWVKGQGDDWKVLEASMEVIEKREKWIDVIWLEKSSIEDQRLKYKRQTKADDNGEKQPVKRAEIANQVEEYYRDDSVLCLTKKRRVLEEMTNQENCDSFMFGRNHEDADEENSEDEVEET